MLFRSQALKRPPGCGGLFVGIVNCDGGKGRTLIRIARFVLFVLVAGTIIAAAQTQGGAGISAGAGPELATTFSGPITTYPVAQVRDARSWEYGPFVNYGNGVGDRSSFKFLSAGMQAAKPLTPMLKAGVFSGQFELGANIMPLWQAYTPAPHMEEFPCVVKGQDTNCLLAVGGGTFRGVSLTPVILRWNFLTGSKRFQPWFQIGRAHV